MAEAEKFPVQTEINPLLSSLIDSCYPNKEIFLPVLISNASQALDEIRFQMMMDKSNLHAKPDQLFIRIVPDKANKTLSIIDNGIGMTMADLQPIARSGTKEFMEELQTNAAVRTVGRFGVGFYTVYFVAKKVLIATKHNDDEQYVLESQADGSFTIGRDVEGEKLGRGTKITLFLKEDQLEYLEKRRIEDLVRKHFEFIDYPINLLKEKATDQDINDDKETINEVSHIEWQRIDKQKPWQHKLEEKTEDDFFKNLITKYWEDHLAVKYFSAERRLKFQAILFVPRRSQFDLFDSHHKKMTNFEFYVNKVSVTDNYENLIPEYLGFVKGVLHVDDLPLDTFREMLRQKKTLKVIKENLMEKCIEMFNGIAENEDDYQKFYNAFSENLKIGIKEDRQNRAKLADFLRYYSTTSWNEMISLKKYVSRMKKGQKDIYYITGESKKAVESSPSLEKLKKKGYEVLFMVDAIDERVVEQLKMYEGIELVSASKVRKKNIGKRLLNVSEFFVDALDLVGSAAAIFSFGFCGGGGGGGDGDGDGDGAAETSRHDAVQ